MHRLIMRGLSEAREAFVGAYIKARAEGEANPALVAARTAYPNAKPSSQQQMASQLLNDRTIREEIAAVLGTEEFVSVDKAVLGLLQIAEDRKAGPTARVNAWKLIAALKGWCPGEESEKGKSSVETEDHASILTPEFIARVLETDEKRNEAPAQSTTTHDISQPAQPSSPPAPWTESGIAVRDVGSAQTAHFAKMFSPTVGPIKASSVFNDEYGSE